MVVFWGELLGEGKWMVEREKNRTKLSFFQEPKILC